MKELITQVLGIVRGMWKYRWAGLLAAWTIAAIGSFMAFRVPYLYEASARVFVDTASILKPLMAGLAVQPNVEQQVGMLSRTLISRPNVEKLIRMADLDLGAKTKPQQDGLIDGLMRSLQIGGAGRDNLYTLSYRDSDPDKAKRVIQSLVSIFVESSLGASRKDTDSAKVFLDEQIKGYERQLEESEARLKAFRLQNIELQGPEGKDAAGRLAEINEQHKRAQLELREAENSRDAAKLQLDAARKQDKDLATKSLLQQSAVAIVVATPELDGRIEAQKRNLDGLLQRFTEQHPDIITARRMIKDLEEQRRKEVVEQRRIAMSAPQLPPPSVESSLVVQELNRVLAATEVQAAALRARVSEYSTRLARARESMKIAPQIEAEASQLNRDYGVIKSGYESLLARRQSAEMSGRLESASGMAEFRLIDPPRVSPKPVSPNRAALVTMSLLGAVGGGLFIAFALSQFRPVPFSAADLRHKTGLPVLGVVSLVMSDAEVRGMRMDMLRFVLASGALVGVYIAGTIAIRMFSL